MINDLVDIKRDGLHFFRNKIGLSHREGTKQTDLAQSTDDIAHRSATHKDGSECNAIKSP